MRPGLYLNEKYIKPLNLSHQATADILGVARSTVTRLVYGEHRLSEDMAARLAFSFGKPAKSWLKMQKEFDNDVRYAIGTF